MSSRGGVECKFGGDSACLVVNDNLHLHCESRRVSKYFALEVHLGFCWTNHVGPSYG